MTGREPRPGTDLEHRLQFETLIADLSSKFINLPPGDVDREVLDAQRRVCELLGLELSALWQWSANNPEVVTLTHLHRPLGGPPVPERMNARDSFPWCLEEARAGRVVRLSSLDEAPPEAARDVEQWRHYGIRTVLNIPLSAGGGALLGAVSFHCVREERPWSDQSVSRLTLAAQVFANALARKAADQALRVNEARLRAAMDLAALGFYEMQPDSPHIFLDAQLCSLLGLPPEATGQAYDFWLEHVHPEDRERVLELSRRAVEGDLTGVSVEYRYSHPQRGIVWLSHLSRVLERDHAGRATRRFGVIKDITQRKQAEESLRQSYAEIERLKDQLQAEADYLKAEMQVTEAHGAVVGQSSAIKKVLWQVEQVAPTESSVLILGETGVGKELIAQAIHRLSRRRDHVLVKVHCAALPSALVESELFGREKGAFTGALTRQIGRFEVAHGSTIFLDEIGELSADVQAKLLRVLQEGQFERLGSPRTIQVNVRVIAATNRDLAEEVRSGRFREDLFYRLNVFPIRVPPLRERPEDIPQLVWTFVQEFATRMGRKFTRIHQGTMEALQRHPWPGNVRQLRNVIEHAAIVSQGDTLLVSKPEETTRSGPAFQTLADCQRDHILKTLERTGWRIKGPKGAATTLGLKPSTLYSRMAKLGIPHRRQKDERTT